jgi:hypothetical protein
MKIEGRADGQWNARRKKWVGRLLSPDSSSIGQQMMWFFANMRMLNSSQFKILLRAECNIAWG